MNYITKNNILTLLPLTSDFVFKRIFAHEKNIHLLKDFIQAILNVQINTLTIQNTELLKDKKNSKLGIVDLRAKINNTAIVIKEMQVLSQDFYRQRNEFYVDKTYLAQYTNGFVYGEALPVFSINILDFNIFERDSYISVCKSRLEPIEDHHKVRL